jgi:tRNA (guanine37-N1)-methyltransferase
MQFHILTLFPEMFQGPLTESILKRAIAAGLIEVTLYNIRNYTTDKHRVTDDTPFGGGGGMVMKPEPLLAAIEAVRETSPVILMSPQGRRFTQRVAQELVRHERLVLVCGRYEGIDERVYELGITDEISIGDYVLTGGELPAMILVDAIARLIPGVLGAEHGAAQDSHATGLLEHPYYTRPAVFRGLEVPQVLQEGNHAKIERWRRQESLRRTWQRRPDMLMSADLREEDRWLLADFAEESLGTRDKD